MYKIMSRTHSGIQTHYYDITTINQGKINEIISWSVYNDSSTSIYKDICNLQFKSNQNQQSNGISYSNSFFIPCNPFKLNTNDYINGYRVIYNQHVCSSNNLNYFNYYDTGIIINNIYYWSGFNICVIKIK